MSGEAEAGVKLIRAGKHAVDLAIPNLAEPRDYLAVTAFYDLARTDAMAMDASLALRAPWKLGLDSKASIARATAQGSVDYVRALSSFCLIRIGASVSKYSRKFPSKIACLALEASLIR